MDAMPGRLMFVPSGGATFGTFEDPGTGREGRPRPSRAPRIRGRLPEPRRPRSARVRDRWDRMSARARAVSPRQRSWKVPLSLSDADLAALQREVYAWGQALTDRHPGSLNVWQQETPEGYIVTAQFTPDAPR